MQALFLAASWRVKKTCAALNATLKIAGISARLAVAMPLLDSHAFAWRNACVSRKRNDTMPSACVLALFSELFNEDADNVAAKRCIDMDAAIKCVGMYRAVVDSIIDMAR